MTIFRPCIDLHQGSVKQIVGGTLSDTNHNLATNHISEHPAEYYAQLYKQHDLQGAHVIMLGPGNETAAAAACAAWPRALQVGGGLTDANVVEWIEKGAKKVHPPSRHNVGLSDACQVILTSFLFPSGRFSLERLQSVQAALGGNKDRLVIDLSCRRVKDTWFVAMNKWQTLTDMEITHDSLSMLVPHCSEFLIHAADNEGLQQGIDTELVQALANWDLRIPITYAGGARSLQDLQLVDRLSKGRIDLTIGSALDIFGGNGVSFDQCIAWNKAQQETS